MWFYPARVLIHEGRVLQACLARDRDRRPRARLAAAPPGRYGNPPPVTMNRREELADGAEAVRVARASRKARPRTEKSPSWSAARRCRRKADWKARCAEPALRPPRFERTRAAMEECPGRAKSAGAGRTAHDPRQLTQRCRWKVTRRLGYPTGIRTASPRSHLEVTWRIDL